MGLPPPYGLTTGILLDPFLGESPGHLSSILKLVSMLESQTSLMVTNGVGLQMDLHCFGLMWLLKVLPPFSPANLEMILLDGLSHLVAAFLSQAPCRFLEHLSNLWSGTICCGSKNIYHDSHSFYGWLFVRSSTRRISWSILGWLLRSNVPYVMLTPKIVTTYFFIAPFRGEFGFFYVTGVASPVTWGVGKTRSHGLLNVWKAHPCMLELGNSLLLPSSMQFGGSAISECIKEGNASWWRCLTRLCTVSRIGHVCSSKSPPALQIWPWLGSGTFLFLVDSLSLCDHGVVDVIFAPS